MIRRCTIFGGDNTTGHRFPENQTQVQDWNQDLILKHKEISKELVQAKFIVCKKHFTLKGYTSDIQLPTQRLAVPSQSERYKTVEHEEFMSGNITDSESIEVVSSTSATINNLKRSPFSVGGKCKSAPSNITYSHDDICVLEAHDSHYGVKQCSRNHKQECELIQSLDAPSFTVLNAEDECKNALLRTPQQHCLCSLEESTEVISQTEHPSHAMSGTDSDVEILLSDEIVYSDWSEDNGGDLVTLSSADSKEAEKPDSGHDESVSSTEAFKLTQSTEHDLTGQDISLESVDAYELMTHAQLIRVIKEQASKLSHMEANLKRYRESQRALFLHLDALREEFEKLEGATKHAVGNVVTSNQ